jgi:uncharacterized membrane protein YdjX (TVP38/TMEM64 family)
MDNAPTTPPASSRSFPWAKLVVLVAFVAVAVVLYLNFADVFNLANLVEREGQLRAWQDESPLAVIGVVFLIYVAATGFSLPGATVLTLMVGWYFGFVRGFILVSFASTMGATLAFLFSRFLLRDFIQRRFGERLDKFNAALEKEGAFFLFTLRLIPAVPFFVVNLVMGLTPLRTSTFWWVSQLGMVPGTMAYVYAGASVPDLQTLAQNGVKGIISPQLIVAFVILGLLPITMKKIIGKIKS